MARFYTDACVQRCRSVGAGHARESEWQDAEGVGCILCTKRMPPLASAHPEMANLPDIGVARKI